MDHSVISLAGPSGIALDTRNTRRAIVRELRLVDGAIALVARGGAPSVTVGGLAFGAQIMPTVTRRARRKKVQVHELWSPLSDMCQVEVRLGG